MVENLHASFINLDHRTDRLAHMTEQVKKTKLNITRTRGIPWKEIPESPQTEVMRNRTPGAIGCHFSQVQVMKDAQAQGKHALVMEDDIIFCEDFDTRLDYIDNWTKTHAWDVIWMGASFHVNPPQWHRFGRSCMEPSCSAQLGYDAKVTDDPRMIRTFGAYVTFAYIVNYESMPKIFSLFDRNLHTSIGIDYLFIKIQPQLNCFSFVPGCVMQMDNRTDIGVGGDGMTIWSGHLRNGPYVFQKNMNDFDPLTFNWAEAR